MKKIILTFCFLLSIEVFAGSQTGKVNYMVVRASDNLVYFTINGVAATNKPPCATQLYWMIKDENTFAGEQHFSILLSSLVSGKEIVINGADTCTRWGDGEDVDTIHTFMQ